MLKEIKEKLVLRVLQDQLDLLDHKDQMVVMVVMVRKEQLAQPDLKEVKVKKEK